MSKTNILNINIDNIAKKELLENLTHGVLVTPNVDHLVKLQNDKKFYEIYQNAEWVICDSKILFLFSKLLKKPIVEAIPGSSFFVDYYLYHKDDLSCKIFILGAASGVADRAMENINKRVGREMAIGAYSPSYGFEKNEKECAYIIDIINNSAANVLLVGVGAPKQEKWIAKYRPKLPKVELFMALGATIDFEAGKISRAPFFIQKMGLEWLYRCYKEPKRLLRRYFCDDIFFFYYLAKQLLGIYKNPF